MGEPFTWRGALAGAPHVVWALVAANALLLLAWAVVVPVYRAPDEPHHVDMVLASSRSLHWPDPDERRLSLQITGSMEASGFAETADPEFSRNVHPALAVDAPPRGQRPAFAELGPDEPSSQDNLTPQHPPTYYWLLGGVLALAPGSENWAHDRVIVFLRVLNAVLVTPLPLLGWASARRLLGAGPFAAPAAVAAAAALVAVPQLSHIGASVNNDNLLVLAVGAVTVVAAAVLRGDTTWRAAVWLGGLSGLALATKGFALFLPVWWAALGLVVAARARRLGAAARWGALVVAAATPGIAWWVANLVRYGTLQPRGRPHLSPPPDFTPDPAGFLAAAGRWLVGRFWGSFGWVEVSLSWPVVSTATGVLAVLVVAAFAIRRHGEPWRRADLAVMLVPFVTLLGMVLYGGWEIHVTEGRFGGLQGRYLFPAVTGLALAAGLGAARALRRWAPLAVLGGGLLLQALGLRAALLRWYGHAGLVDYQISGAALLAWAAWPRWAVLAVLGGLALAAGWAVAKAARYALDPEPRP